MSEPLVTSIEPPGLATAIDEADWPTIQIHVTISEHDLTTRTASCTLSADATDSRLAETLLECVRGCAEMRGRGLAAAIRQRMVQIR